MTRMKIGKLEIEELETRIAPCVFNQPGNSDEHRANLWSKTPECQEPPPGEEPSPRLDVPLE